MAGSANIRSPMPFARSMAIRATLGRCMSGEVQRGGVAERGTPASARSVPDRSARLIPKRAPRVVSISLPTRLPVARRAGDEVIARTAGRRTVLARRPRIGVDAARRERGASRSSILRREVLMSRRPRHGIMSALGRWPVARQLTNSGLGDAAVSESTRQLHSRLHGVRTVQSICPYCAVGCSTLVHVKKGEIVDIEGNPESPINQGTLCPKGADTLQYTINPKIGRA